MARDFLLMGVVNVTPDSFSDGGRFIEPSAAVAHGARLAEEGAAILDIGGEWTRAGAQPVGALGGVPRPLPGVEGRAAAGRGVGPGGRAPRGARRPAARLPRDGVSRA